MDFKNANGKAELRKLVILVSVIVSMVVLFSAFIRAVTINSTGPVNSGLIALWHFDEGSGTAANDSSGNGDTGTLINSPAWITNSSCKFGNCLYFNGINNFVTISNTSTKGDASFTISAWIKPNSPTESNPQYVIATGDGEIHIETTGVVTFDAWDYRNGSSSSHYISTFTLQAGNWYHIVGTASGNSSFALYINGALISTTTSTTTASGIYNDQMIGDSGCTNNLGNAICNGGTPGGYFNGTIDEVRVYNRVLSAQEISDLYNGGVLIHGGNGSTGYSDLASLSLTNTQITNSTLTGYTCQGSNCNFSIILDNLLGRTGVSDNLTFSNFNVTNVYYNASDGTWRNVTELGGIGQGSWNFTNTVINYSLAGADGMDYGIRDSQPGGSYWATSAGSVYGKINISNDFITVSSSTSDFKIYNSTNGLLFNSTWNSMLLDNSGLNSTYNLGSTQNTTVYFYDWTNQTWKVWMNGTGNSSAGMPNWLDPRYKQEFKWRYAFSRSGYPSVNYTFLMTAADPFVRVFVDSNATGLGSSNISSTTSVVTGPVTIGTSTSGGATAQTNQLHICYAAGLYWAWYDDGPNIGFRTSADGITWSSETTVTSNFGTTSEYAIACSGTSVYYATASINHNVYYRYGTMNTNGTITWAIAEGSFTVTNTGSFYPVPTVAIDGSGNWWISVVTMDGTTNCSSGGCDHIENWLCTNPTSCSWTDKKDVTTLTHSYANSIILPITSGVAVVYENDASGNPWDVITSGDGGSTWSSAVSTANNYGYLFSAMCVSIGNTVYCDGNVGTGTYLAKFTYGGSSWTESQINGFSNDISALSTDGTSLYAFDNYYGIGSVKEADCSTSFSCGPVTQLVSGESSMGNNVIGAGATTSGVTPLIWTAGASSPFSVRFTKVNNMNQHTLTIPLSLGENRTSLTTADPGLVGYWNFNEGGGTSAYDSSGNGNNGALINSPTWVNGIYGNALNFSSTSSQYVSVPSSSALNLNNNSFSISVWVRPYNTYPPTQGIVDKSSQGSAANSPYALWITQDPTTGYVFYTGNGAGGYDKVTGPAPILNQWQHIVVVLTPTNLMMYMNGTLVATSTRTTSVTTNTGAVLIGTYGTGAGWLNGTIDEVRLYNRALSTSEIQQIYQTGLDQQKPGIYFTTNGGSNQEAWFATTNERNVYRTLSNTTPSYLNITNYPAGNLNSLNISYIFNSTINNNLLFTLGTAGRINTANFSPANNQTGFSNETIESVANSTLTFYDLLNTNVAPSTPVTTIGTGTDSTYSTGSSIMRHILYSSGLWWEFYGDGTKIVCKTSPDGINWSSNTTIPTSGYTANAGNIAFWLSGPNTFYYAADSAGASSNWYWRYGTLSSAGCGSISWSNSEQTVTADSTTNGGTLSLTVDSSSNIWVCLETSHTEVMKFDGSSWTKQLDLPSDNMCAITSNGSHVSVVYGVQGGSALNVSTTGDGGNTWSSAVSSSNSFKGFDFDAVDIGDTVHVAGVTSNGNNVAYFQCTYPCSSIANEQTIDSTNGEYGATISTDSNSNLVIEFAPSSSMVKYVLSSNNGTSWGSTFTLAGSETSIGSISLTSAFSFGNNAIGVSWMAGSSSPYNVRFSLISIPTFSKQNAGSGLTQFSVPSTINYDGGAAGIWHFDEGAGANVTDASGNGNNGYVNATWITNSSCKYGSCLNFDGVGQFVQVPSSPTLDNVNQITVETWFYSRASQSADITRKEGQWVIQISPTTIYGFISFSGGVWISASAPMPSTNSWHHVVVTYDGTTIKLYLDGVLSGTTVYAATRSTSSNLLKIGNGNTPFNGLLDEYRVYPRVLTNQQIWEQYARQASLYYDDFGTATGKTYRYFGVEDSNTSMEPITPSGTVLHLRFNDNSTTNVTDNSGYGNNGYVSTSPSLVQTASSTGGDQASNGWCYLSSPITAGDLLVVPIQMNAGTVASMTDSLGSTFQEVQRVHNNNVVDMWYANAKSTSISDNITMTFNSGNSAVPYCAEFTGVSTTLNTNSSGTGSGTALSVSSFTPTSGSLIVAAAYFESVATMTPGSGYTALQTGYRFSEYKPSSSGAETAPATTSTSATWEEVAGAWAPSVQTSGCKTNFGSCVSLNSNSFNLTIPSSSSLGAGGSVTVAAWINMRTINAVNQESWIVDKAVNGVSYPYALVVGGTGANKAQFSAADSVNNPFVSGTTALNDSQWHQLVGVRDNSTGTRTLYIYVDGKLEGSTTDTTTGAVTNSNSVVIGMRGDGTRSFNGLVDEVFVINRSLTSDEVYQLYLGGYNRTIGNHTHRVAAADGIYSAAYNLSAHDPSILQDYDQRNLLITGINQALQAQPLLYSNVGSNTTTPAAGSSVLLYSYWTGNVNISSIILSTNETGTWKNYTDGTYGSPLSNLNVSTSWANFTWLNTSLAVGTTVGWQVYANDTSNNWNATGVQTFNITATGGYSITLSFNESRAWWNDVLYASGKVLSNNVPVSSASVSVNQSLKTLCTIITNSSGIFACIFNAPNSTGTYTYTAYTTLVSNSTVLLVGPNYGVSPIGTVARGVINVPVLTQDNDGTIGIERVNIIVYRIT